MPNLIENFIGVTHLIILFTSSDDNNPWLKLSSGCWELSDK